HARGGPAGPSPQAPPWRKCPLSPTASPQAGRARRTACTHVIALARKRERGGPSSETSAVRAGHPQMASSLLVKRIVEKRPQLRNMFRHEPGRGRGRRRPADITRPGGGAASVIEHPHDVGFDKMPGSHIPGLLLAPHDLGPLESAKFLHQGFYGERVELFDTQQIDVLDAAFFALLVEIEIDLAGA